MDRNLSAATSAERPSAESTGELSRRAVDAIERVVGTVHDKAVRPLALASRAVVFGLIVAALGTVVMVLLSISILRILDVYAFENRIWLSYLTLGAVFSLAGLLLWSKRFQRDQGGAERI